MKIETKEFYYIDHGHDTLPIGSIKARPILWNNKGLFCTISRRAVQNMLDLIRDATNLPVLNRKELNVFHWSEGTLIDAKIAYLLLS